eukprot:scaffold88132_cov24-Phaeocystis_antarctica.AAC.1
MQSLRLGAAHVATLPRASLRAAACGPGGVSPRGGVWPRKRRVEGRRRPKKAEPQSPKSGVERSGNNSPGVV